jgi:hypothetical protein
MRVIPSAVKQVQGFFSSKHHFFTQSLSTPTEIMMMQTCKTKVQWQRTLILVFGDVENSLLVDLLLNDDQQR